MKILLAHIFSRLPSSCPFAKNIALGSFTLHIPPLCKLNPLYNQLMAARWWAMRYLEAHR
jgi:hypothetical protein